MRFQNPILRGFNPDPSICAVPASTDSPRRYYLTTSTFEYFPGCPIYTSLDLINWTTIGHALNRPSQLNIRTVEPGAGSWASTLRYRSSEKRFYLANGVFHRYRPSADERIFPRGFYVYTDNIWDDSAWSDPVYFDNPGFDQDLFWEGSKVYLSTTNRLAERPLGSKQKDFAIHVSEIDIKTGRTLTPPVVVRKSHHGIAEGSHIIKRNNWYYLFTAEGGTEAGHQEWVFRSRNGPYGPWEGTDKPLWYNGPNEEVQRTGHADVFEGSDGQWWAVLLGVRPLKRGDVWLEPQLGRETFLVKVDWVNDWPIFNGGENIHLDTVGHGCEDHIIQVEESRVWKESFQRTALELGWYQKQTPLKAAYSITDRPGFLRLYGGCYDLSSPEGPSMLLRKQCSYSETFSTVLEFNPSRNGYEAGLCLWWSSYSYACIGIARRSSGIVVSCRIPTGTAGVFKTLEPATLDGFEPGQHIALSIESRGTSYVLDLSTKDFEHEITVEAADLTAMPPVGGAFTGAMYGLYAFGKGEPVLDDVDFSQISIVKV